MSDLQQREYYRLYTGTNQEKGIDKIYLGYESETTEITLKKDNTTFFHVPFFAQTIPVQESDLVGAGAIPGPIPATADKIFKKLGGYGNSTPWGESQQRQDGTWLCSWLYALSSETPQWLDRYYNPGSLSYEEALKQGVNFLDYQKSDPVYYDVPSTLTLEAGSWYQFFHQGEKTAAEVIKTFAGGNKTRLRLNIDDWSCLCPDDPRPVDNSIYNNTVTIDNFKMSWINKTPDPGYLDRSALSFVNNDFLNCQIAYSDSYNTANEFTISFWVNSPDWSQSPSTQLLGNFNRGGYGVYFNNLKYYPFLVVPETTYGHFFLFNQNGQIYDEKNSQTTLGQPAKSLFVFVNDDGEFISIEGTTNRIYKYNHLGDIITQSKDINNNFITLAGEPKLATLDKDNNTLVITTSGTYIFDQDLIFTSYLSAEKYIPNQQICYNLEGVLVKQSNCLDIKYDNNNQKWHVDLSGRLFCNDILVPNVTNISVIQVDPNNDIWALEDKNNVYKIDSTTRQIKKTFRIGIRRDTPEFKNIGFVYSYDRSTGKKEWYAFIYHSDERVLYQTTLDGIVKVSTFLPQKLNILDPETARQNKDLLTFLCKGDFTGYDWKRVFHKVLYNNKVQMQFKVAVNPPNVKSRNSTKKVSVPVDYLVNESWHLITVILKNKNINLYINNYLRGSLQLPAESSISYTYKNNFFIGCPAGRSENINKELVTTSLIWDGYIDSIRFYDYALPEYFIQYFIKEKIVGDNIIWNIITAPLQYVESIDSFFKHKPPGAKSQFFNLKINQPEITDPRLKQSIENDIRAALEQVLPINVELLNIEWN